MSNFLGGISVCWGKKKGAEQKKIFAQPTFKEYPNKILSRYST